MIYVITHKVFDDGFIDKNHYNILHVGKNQNCKDEYLRDDSQDNIADKNPHYCELTGQYWIWKNDAINPNEITGLVHYRRFFTTLKEDFLYTYFKIMPKMLDYEKIEQAFLSYDIILPKRVNIYRTVREFYSDMHDGDDLELARQVIAELYPEYIVTYDDVMNSHSFYFGNMLICKKKLFDQYSKWLFEILFTLENRLDLEKRGDKYQSRVVGFISERLLQVWVKHNNLKVKEYPIYNTEKRRLTIFEKNFNRAKKIGKLWSKNEN